jgi:hypothetical protein
MKTKFTLLIVAALFFTVATQAQEYNGHGYVNNKSNREVRNDKKDIYHDNARIHFDKNQYFREEAHGNYRDARYSRFELSRDRKNRFFDKVELRSDRRQIKKCY